MFPGKQAEDSRRGCLVSLPQLKQTANGRGGLVKAALGGGGNFLCSGEVMGQEIYKLGVSAFIPD